MNLKNQFKKAPSISLILGIIYTIIGIIFIAVGIFVFSYTKNFLSNSEQTDAVISRIEKEYYNNSDGERRIRHYVWVRYEVNGRQFEEALNYYNSGMNEGDVVAINYDPDDPSEIMSGSGLKVIELVMIPLGSIFTILGLIFISLKVVSDVRRKKLMRSGECLTGIITNVAINKFVTINHRHPYKAECEVTDPYSGEKFLYSSENITGDISDLVGNEVTVYVDSNNKKNYYVDIYELTDRYSSDENIHDYRR